MVGDLAIVHPGLGERFLQGAVLGWCISMGKKGVSEWLGVLFFFVDVHGKMMKNAKVERMMTWGAQEWESSKWGILPRNS